jgi:parallel beta-helix repeat protein
MKGFVMGRTVAATLGLAASFLGAGLGSARADSTPVTECGQPLDAPGDYHLAQDLGPCAGHGVVISASDVRFTLAGHTISGISSQASCDLDNPQTGVWVEGSTANVRVSGGTVTGFVDGIGLYGSHSRATALRVVDNCVYGILVGGTGNRVDTSLVSGSDDGVLLCEAQEAVVTSNELVGNLRYGAVVSCTGTDHNEVIQNIMRENGLPTGDGGGVGIFNGSQNRIAGNAISGNWDGIWLASAGSTVVEDNTVNANLSHGIGVNLQAPGVVVQVESNTAFGNGAVDLLEGNPCGTNTWTDNHFGTSAGCTM